jgi:hypothetical protein
MTISENNYEAYMLDYLEGNLDPLMTAELMAFLVENPELEKLLPGYDGLVMNPGNEIYDAKAILKKDFSDIPVIQENNFDEFCIACSENLLNEQDRLRLAGYLKEHPAKQAAFDLFQQLRLTTDARVVFPGKSGLKKHASGITTRRLMLYAIAMAASVALLFILVIRNKPAESLMTGNSDPAPAALKTPPPEALPAQKTTDAPVAAEKNTIRPNNVLLHQEVIAEQLPATPRETLPVEPVKPLSPAVITSTKVPPGPVPHSWTSGIPQRNDNDLLADNPGIQSESFWATRTGKLINRLNFWKAAETAVSGFNYLTESQLSLERKTDEDGRLTELLITTESYTISGYKMK